MPISSFQEAFMSQVYNPEADVIAEIERLELEARAIRRRVEHVRNSDDQRVLNRQLQEIEEQVEYLKSRLP
jgi:hypothetical protein